MYFMILVYCHRIISHGLSSSYYLINWSVSMMKFLVGSNFLQESYKHFKYISEYLN